MITIQYGCAEVPVCVAKLFTTSLTPNQQLSVCFSCFQTPDMTQSPFVPQSSPDDKIDEQEEVLN